MKFWLRVSAPLLVAAVLCGQTVKTGDPMHGRVRAIGERLKCQCGCPYTIAGCEAMSCEMRPVVNDQISKDLAAGLSEPAIFEKLKQQYGPLIINTPKPEGFNLLAYLMPFVALIIGLLVIRVVVVRWRKPAAARPAVASNAPVDRFRDEIEKELGELE
jgi:cytochrome c-type biogenesis protein CcmH